MCGRFFVDAFVDEKIESMVSMSRDRKNFSVRGEIVPSEKAMVLIRGASPQRTTEQSRRMIREISAGGGSSGFTEVAAEIAMEMEPEPEAVSRGLVSELMSWGFWRYDPMDPRKKTLLINARSETILEKPMFRDAAMHRRCIIPVKRYFEWNRRKEKASFQRTDGEVLYMAGVYQRFEEGNRFVVLTTQANESVEPVHDRMPLILEENELHAWIYDDEFARYILRKTPVMLERYQEYEQQTLQFL
ncbi:MAG: SOS response-associated peptidase family protein [Lachnospiraceae bacterium]|nr:SOS response-associated peptidase family protein [Lachnospiraceae bacterium]